MINFRLQQDRTKICTAVRTEPHTCTPLSYQTFEMLCNEVYQRGYFYVSILQPAQVVKSRDGLCKLVGTQRMGFCAILSFCTTNHNHHPRRDSTTLQPHCRNVVVMYAIILRNKLWTRKSGPSPKAQWWHRCLTTTNHPSQPTGQWTKCRTYVQHFHLR